MLRARNSMPLCVTQPTDAVALQSKIGNFLLEQLQIWLASRDPADGALIQLAIGLRTRGAHGGPLAGIEGAKLNARLVRGQRHGAAQGVDLLDQMSLADAADRGVAAHLPQRLDIVGQQ